MKKLTFHEKIFELLIFIIVVALGIISLLFTISLWLTWICWVLLMVAFWRIIQKWSRKNKNEIPGRTFEFLFFFLLFVASYLVTFIASYVDNPNKIVDYIIMSFSFTPVVISAGYCGWLYYIEGITNKKYWKKKPHKKIDEEES